MNTLEYYLRHHALTQPHTVAIIQPTQDTTPTADFSSLTYGQLWQRVE